jgi:phosphoglycerol transferase MdoB-like AlkP superfamily enzyme
MPPILSHLVLDDRLRPWRFGAAVLLFTLILMIGSIPGARAEIANVASGLVLHSLAYSFITFLLYTGSTGSRTRRALKAVLIVLAMGALDEFVQSFLPYRHAAVSDWMVDGASAMLTACVLWAGLPAPAEAGPA